MGFWYNLLIFLFFTKKKSGVQSGGGGESVEKGGPGFVYTFFALYAGDMPIGFVFNGFSKT